jgi:hypothetical protein
VKMRERERERERERGTTCEMEIGFPFWLSGQTLPESPKPSVNGFFWLIEKIMLIYHLNQFNI